MSRPTPQKPEIRERGGVREGQPQFADERLFMQLLAFGHCDDWHPLASALAEAGVESVLYEDLHDPFGVGLLALSPEPAFFLDTLRPMLRRDPFASLSLKPRLSFFGRTYAIGYEPDLQEVLFDRPRRAALNPAWPWAVWYPLRRNGAFAQLPPEEQKSVLAEHGMIGHGFGAADYAHDIRLACFGLDTEDNDFLVGLVGPQLAPLSILVQTMRRTKQTSQFIEKLGPFFVGRAAWRSGDVG